MHAPRLHWWPSTQIVRCMSAFSSHAQASVLWTVAIALALREQVVARRTAPERLETWYHIVCWGMPCVVALVLLLSRRLGPADEPRVAWCWIASQWDPPSNKSAAFYTTSIAAADQREWHATQYDVYPTTTASTPHAQASHTLSLESVGDGPAPWIASGGGGDARWVQLVAFYLPLLLAFSYNLATYLRVGQVALFLWDRSRPIPLTRVLCNARPHSPHSVGPVLTALSFTARCWVPKLAHALTAADSSRVRYRSSVRWCVMGRSTLPRSG